MAGFLKVGVSMSTIANCSLAQMIEDYRQRDPQIYGKASGMLLAQRYFPHHFPFYNLNLISTIEEWWAIQAHYGERMIHRVDYPLGHAHKSARVGTTGLADDMSALIAQVRSQGPDGVVMVWQSRRPPIPRYQNWGGFNIAFSADRQLVTIELVGCGFDGSDLTRGAALHEYYQIPWGTLRQRQPQDYGRSFLQRISTRHWHIGLGEASEEYIASRERRYRMLVQDCRYDPQVVTDMLPKAHIYPSASVIRRLLEVVVDPIIAHLISQL